MSNKTQTTTEYEIGTKINLTEQGSDNATTQLVYGGLKRAQLRMKLEARMLAYDALHRTQYRKLYHAVLARDRNAAFEKKIGLVRSK